MKVAVISDVHGNLEALKTVLDDIKSRNIDKIYCLGDIITKGSHSLECVNLIRNNCDVVIRGNCDEYYINLTNLSNMSDIDIKRYNWVMGMLDDDSINYLSKLPYSYEFYMSGRLIRLVHAHPKKIDNVVCNIDYFDRYYEMFLPSDNTISNEKADVLIYGHIHIPFVQKIYNRFLINTGSVGNAMDVFRNPNKDGNDKFTAVANYLILSGNYDSKNVNDKFSFELVNVPYDIEKEISNNKDNVEFDSYCIELRRGIYRDMSIIDASFADRGINKEDI